MRFTLARCAPDGLPDRRPYAFAPRTGLRLTVGRFGSRLLYGRLTRSFSHSICGRVYTSPLIFLRFAFTGYTDCVTRFHRMGLLHVTHIYQTRTFLTHGVRTRRAARHTTLGLTVRVLRRVSHCRTCLHSDLRLTHPGRLRLALRAHLLHTSLRLS